MVWSALSGIFGVLVGIFLGHRMALGRDKRREFNAATRLLRHKLRQHVEEIPSGYINKPILDQDIDEVVSALGESRSSKITLAYNRYAVSKKKGLFSDKYGMGLIPNSPGAGNEVLSDAKALYAVIQPK